MPVLAVPVRRRLCAWAALGKPSMWKSVPHESMLWAFHTEEDPYCGTAAEALGLDYIDLRDRYRAGDKDAKEIRQNMGKVPTLASLYVISPKGLRQQAWNDYDILWTMEEADRKSVV